MKITTQFDGFEVVANVYGVSGSPYGLSASLEVEDMEAELTEPKDFEAAYDMPATDDNLALVMKRDESSIVDRIIEDAHDSATRGDY